jgi:hypothetical protein
MSSATFPGWFDAQIAELEAQTGRRITEHDLGCLDINYVLQTMTVARDPLLSEIRIVETAWNEDHGADPELQ